MSLSASDRRAVLEEIREANGGILKPRFVLDAATAADHPLHGEFLWDNEAAGEAYRLAQAEQLIRAVVVVLPHSVEPVRAYVHLSSDRGTHTYRAVADVLSDEQRREEMLADARKEAKAFIRKYRTLSALAGFGPALSALEGLLSQPAEQQPAA